VPEKKGERRLKSQTTSAKSIRPLPLWSNAETGSFAAIRVISRKYRTTSLKSLLPLPFTSLYSPSASGSVGPSASPPTW